MLRFECRFTEPSDADAIRRFGQRLADSNVDNHLALLALDPSLPGDTPEAGTFPVRRRSLVAVDQDEVRATQLFFENEIYIRGKPHSFVWPAGPISESLINPRYALCSVMLLKHSLAQQSLHMALGLGSYENTIARIFLALGWHHKKVPFFFFPVRPNRVLRELRVSLGKHKQLVKTLLLCSGMGWLGSSLVCHLRRLWNARHQCGVENEERFGAWADQIWDQCHGEYGALTRRDAAALNAFYAPKDRRYHRLRVTRDGACIGWLLVTLRNMHDDKYFGNLRVGTLVDGLCHPEDVADVMNVGLRYLLEKDIDMCVANWSHRAWATASRRLGFLTGPSNFIYFVSRAGVPPLLSQECPLEEMHLNRGDGDGPIHLAPDDPIMESCEQAG